MESLRDRGLHGACLVITDTHRGLAATADRWFQRTARQPRRMHYIPNLLAALPRSHQHTAAALFRTILAQPDTDTDTWDQDGAQPAASFPKTGPLIDTARAEVLAFAAFPKAHRQKI